MCGAMAAAELERALSLKKQRSMSLKAMEGDLASKEEKVWEAVARRLATDPHRVACFDGVPLETPGGHRCLAPTLPSASIS